MNPLAGTSDCDAPSRQLRLFRRATGETSVHIHLPKPLHGWREVVGEVGIIVIGILIALSAEELVQTIHWSHMVDEAKESLTAQLQVSYFNSRERIAFQGCTERQLDRLDELLERPAIPDKLNRVNIPVRLWGTSAWDAAVSSGAAAHMTPEDRNGYATLFAFTDRMGELNAKEFDITTSLDTIYRHPKLSESTRDRLIQNVSQLRSYQRLLALGSRQWLNSARELGMNDKVLTAEDRRDLTRSRCLLPDSPPSPGH